MPELLQRYFDTEGPFGLPMKDQQARQLEEKLKTLPREDGFDFRRLSLARGLAELVPEGRTDVSWITEETPDRQADVVLAGGMDDSHFQLNPIVTLNHNYTQPPVGRSLWRRKVKEGPLIGVKAKTFYPVRPVQWAGDWLPDFAFDLVQAGLLRGKSIGFLPLKLRSPSADEIQRRPAWKNVRYLIEEWLLLEYSCCYLPMQPHAVVEEVAKSWTQLLPPALAKLFSTPGNSPPASDMPMSLAAPFVTLSALESYLRSPIFAENLAKKLLLSWQKARGMV